MNTTYSFPRGSGAGLGRSILFCAALAILGVLQLPASSRAQNYLQQNYQALLEQNIMRQNNLKNNINYLAQLSDQAKGRAQMARMAGERGAFTYWKDQYYQLQARINQFRMQLSQLEGQEQNIRSAIHPGNNPVQRSSSGGKPMIPAYSAQNPNSSPNSSIGQPGVSVNPGPAGGSGSGGGGYQYDPNTVRLLDMGAPGR